MYLQTNDIRIESVEFKIRSNEMMKLILIGITLIVFSSGWLIHILTTAYTLYKIMMNEIIYLYLWSMIFVFLQIQIHNESIRWYTRMVCIQSKSVQEV